MVAALYSSRDDGGTKYFVKCDDVHFGWESIEDVYRADLIRAKNGKSRRVPKLKYSYIVRDACSRLNVLPAKIMQVWLTRYIMCLRHMHDVLFIIIIATIYASGDRRNCTKSTR